MSKLAEERPMRRYDWVLLDIDGTLLDFHHAEAQALTCTPSELGLTVPEGFLSDYLEINDGLWRKFESGLLSARDVRTQRFKHLFDRLNLSGDPNVFSEAYLTNLSKYSTFIPGAERLLAGLKDRIGVVALTNGFSDVQHARIARLGLQGAFDHVIISEEVGVAKPEPGVFDIVFGRIGNPAKGSVLMIGDSLSSDIQGGANYGIDTCWFNPNRETHSMTLEPTFEIRHLDEVDALIFPPQDT